MSYYGYVFPGMSGICQDFNTIRNLARLFPYPKYRVFKTEEEAIRFVKIHRREQMLSSIQNYGDTFPDMYLNTQYFITPNDLYFNIFTDKVGNIDIDTDIVEEVEVKKRTGLISIHLANIQLNDRLISSHAIAIYYLLKFVGSYLDVCIEIPDCSIYYMLFAYTGRNEIISKLHSIMQDRLGAVAVTVHNW